MNIIRIVCKICVKFSRITRPFVYRRACLAMNWYSMGRVDWPESVEASVPVRIDGQGTVVLAKGVKFGYRPASRLGKGTIHVQARTINSNISIGQGTHINNNSSFIFTDNTQGYLYFFVLSLNTHSF